MNTNIVNQKILNEPLISMTDEKIEKYLGIPKDHRKVLAIEYLAKTSFLLQDTEYRDILNELFSFLLESFNEEESKLKTNQEAIENDDFLKKLQQEILGGTNDN